MARGKHNRMTNRQLIIIALIYTSSTYAGDKIDLHKMASPNGLVTIVNVRGEVDIVGWDKNEIAIQGELDDLAEKLIFEVRGNKTLIEVILPRRVKWGDGSELEIWVPLESRVDFEGVSTEISVKNIHGGLRVKSVSGDITAENIHDRMLINSISGEIKIEDSQGTLHVSTVSGSLDVRSHVGNADLESVSGDIELTCDDSERLRVRTVSGEIEITSNLLKGATLEIGSISGDIELELTGQIDAHFLLDAGISGEIENQISDDNPSKSFIGQEKLDMTLGNGSAEISIRTVSADIRIE